MSFPLSRKLTWTQPVADATHGSADFFEVRQNGTLVGSPTAAEQLVSIPGAGAYTFEVKALNQYGESGPAIEILLTFPPNTPVNIDIESA